MAQTPALVLSIVLAVLFTFTGRSKLVTGAESLRVRDQLGMKPPMWVSIGVLELAAVAGLLVGIRWAPLGIAAAAGACGLMIGAAFFRLRARAGIGGVLIDVVVFVLAAGLIALHLRGLAIV